MIAKLSMICKNANKSIDINKYTFDGEVIRSLHFEYIIAM